jgi:hypothetical protein
MAAFPALMAMPRVAVLCTCSLLIPDITNIATAVPSVFVDGHHLEANPQGIEQCDGRIVGGIQKVLHTLYGNSLLKELVALNYPPYRR